MTVKTAKALCRFVFRLLVYCKTRIPRSMLSQGHGNISCRNTDSKHDRAYRGYKAETARLPVPAGSVTGEILIEQEVFPYSPLYKSPDLLPGSYTIKGWEIVNVTHTVS